MIRGCMLAAGVGRIHCFKGIMNVTQYVDILQKNIAAKHERTFWTLLCCVHA